MPQGSALPSLETLDILFCYNLKAILYDDGGYYSPRYQLPRLRRMYLRELPLLQHLRVKDTILTAPEWEERHVRGCWSLRRLPRLCQEPSKKAGRGGERGAGMVGQAALGPEPQRRQGGWLNHPAAPRRLQAHATSGDVHMIDVRFHSPLKVASIPPHHRVHISPRIHAACQSYASSRLPELRSLFSPYT
jgi:hypothetical protein